jgi:hypothetical protein
MRLLLLVLLLLVTQRAFGQEAAAERLNREMTLEKEYNPAVQDADKVSVLPVLGDAGAVQKADILYADKTYPLLPDREYDVQAMGGMAVEMMNGTQKGRLFFAGGMFMTFDGEASYRLLDTEKDRVGLSFSYHSTNGTRKYLPPHDAFDTKAEWNEFALGASYVHRLAGGAKVQLKADGCKTGFNYFGNPFLHRYRSDVPLPGETQDMELLHVQAELSSPADADFLRYRLRLSGRGFAHLMYGTDGSSPIAEDALALDFDVNAPLLDWFDQRLGVSGKLQAHIGDAFEAVFTPYYSMRGERWQALLGARLAFLTGEKKTAVATPNIAASLEVARKTVAYAEVRGALRTNTWYEVSRLNPYAAPMDSGQHRLTPSRQWLDGQLGLRTGAMNGAWFDLFVGYRATDDDYLFLPDTTFLPLTVEEGVDTRQVFFGVSCRYTHDEWLEASLRAVCNRWNRVGSDAAVYERPTTEVSAGLRFLPTETLTFSLDYQLAAGRKSLIGKKSYHLKNINALHLTGALNLTEAFSLHLRLNNVLFQRYELYCGYPLQGFHALAGLSFIF